MRLDLLETLKQQSNQQRLIGLDRAELVDRAEQRFQMLTQLDQANPTVLLAEPEPIDFLAGFVAAVAAECPVFLGNPQWAEAEWKSVLSLVQPACVWISGQHDSPLLVSHQKPQFLTGTMGSSSSPGIIGIPTGGSSGQIRFALHTWETLTASVAGFRAYFQIDCSKESTTSARINSCCVLPLFHVSGLMQFMRSFCSGGKFALFASKDLAQQIQHIDPAEFFISLVPTQLQRLLQNPANLDWLSQFQMIMLGGAPAWSDLLETARSHQLRIALTYGMTETASQVVALKPEEFLQGRLPQRGNCFASGCGQVLPHAQLTVRDPQGNLVEPGQSGIITIRAASLCRGYLPAQPDSQLEQTQQLVTDDLGYFDSAGYLHLIGRNSQKIITGGENVFPAEVEAAIRQTGLVQDVCVIGLPDSFEGETASHRAWGEVVTALIVPVSGLVPGFSISTLEAALQLKLSRYKQPKKWLIVDRIPRNLQGKLNYEQLKQIALHPATGAVNRGRSTDDECI